MTLQALIYTNFGGGCCAQCARCTCRFRCLFSKTIIFGRENTYSVSTAFFLDCLLYRCTARLTQTHFCEGARTSVTLAKENNSAANRFRIQNTLVYLICCSVHCAVHFLTFSLVNTLHKHPLNAYYERRGTRHSRLCPRLCARLHLLSYLLLLPCALAIFIGNSSTE